MEAADGKLVICFTPWNPVGVFHEIYEHVVLPALYPDLDPALRHTLAVLAETAFSNDGLITNRDMDQYSQMLDGHQDTVKRLIDNYSAALEEITQVKFPKANQEAIRDYALAKADALHRLWTSSQMPTGIDELNKKGTPDYSEIDSLDRRRFVRRSGNRLRSDPGGGRHSGFIAGAHHRTRRTFCQCHSKCILLFGREQPGRQACDSRMGFQDNCSPEDF